MLDYDETSIAKVYNNVTKEKSEYQGTAQIRAMFEGLFKDLCDLATLDAPVVEVDEACKTVFLVWQCPGCGFNTATDTFVFGPDFKIKRQSVVACLGPRRVRSTGRWTVFVSVCCVQNVGERANRLLEAAGVTSKDLCRPPCG